MQIDIGKSDNSIITFDLATLIDTRLLIQANSGGGKSFAIRRLLEQSHGQVQQIVYDLEGEFPTLREKYDYIIAGKNGDTPAHPSSAKLLARRILELGVSVICDLSELKYHERIQFVRYSLESMMAAPRELWHPILVVIDECHHFCPEKGQAESHQAVIDLATRGRKRGFCSILATQRLSKLHKDACAELLNKMIGRTSLDIDQARAADELGIMGKQDRIALRNLSPGEFHIYGPALRKGKDVYSGVIQAKVGVVNSTHPKVGSRQLGTPPKPTAKIKEILGKLTDLPEQAEKEIKDVAFLSRENAELKRKITLAEKEHPAIKPCNHAAEIESLVQDNRSLRSQIGTAEKLFEQIKSDMQTKLPPIYESIIGKASSFKPVQEDHLREVKKMVPERPRMDPPARAKVQSSSSEVERHGVPNPQQKILNGLASLETIMVFKIVKQSLAAICGVSSKSSAYINNLGALRNHKESDITLPLISYPDPGYVSLTEEGRRRARLDSRIIDIDDLHDAWCRMVSGPKANILKHLIGIYPDDILKTDLAVAIGVSALSSSYINNLGALRSLGAIEYPGQGRVKASDLLFPEGL